jgi:SAM-dependent methyltransferase
MPSIKRNRDYWDKMYQWERQGDEWSDCWGGPKSQWNGSILPRVRSFLPATSILEIAPGYGRWSQFLRNYCKALTLVDISENCIEACRKRFSNYSHIEYHVNDGKSLSMIEDDSIDFAFSFDSLVHAEAQVIGLYLKQLNSKFTSNGVGFFHHSNIGEYRSRTTAALLKVVPSKSKEWLIRRNILFNDHWRACSMTGVIFNDLCDEAGLQCISQELVNWGGERLIDCFSIFTKKSSKWAKPCKIIENPFYMQEARGIKSGLVGRIK